MENKWYLMEQLPCLNKIFFYGDKRNLRGRIKTIEKLIRKILSDHKRILNSLEINLINDSQLLEINKQSLNHDYYTDIITFDYREQNIITGDIYISVDRTNENAKAYRVKKSDELIRVICHGTLHLCGYKDKTKNEIQKMRSMEEKYINLYNKDK